MLRCASRGRRFCVPQRSDLSRPRLCKTQPPCHGHGVLFCSVVLSGSIVRIAGIALKTSRMIVVQDLVMILAAIISNNVLTHMYYKIWPGQFRTLGSTVGPHCEPHSQLSQWGPTQSVSPHCHFLQCGWRWGLALGASMLANVHATPSLGRISRNKWCAFGPLNAVFTPHVRVSDIHYAVRNTSYSVILRLSCSTELKCDSY